MTTCIIEKQTEHGEEENPKLLFFTATRHGYKAGTKRDSFQRCVTRLLFICHICSLKINNEDSLSPPEIPFGSWNGGVCLRDASVDINCEKSSMLTKALVGGTQWRAGYALTLACCSTRNVVLGLSRAGQRVALVILCLFHFFSIFIYFFVDFLVTN